MSGMIPLKQQVALMRFPEHAQEHRKRKNKTERKAATASSVGTEQGDGKGEAMPPPQPAACPLLCVSRKNSRDPARCPSTERVVFVVPLTCPAQDRISGCGQSCRGSICSPPTWRTNPLSQDKDVGCRLCCSVARSCLTLCDPMDCSRPGLPVHHQLLELAQTHVH